MNSPDSAPTIGPGVSNRSGNTPTRKSRAAASSAGGHVGVADPVELGDEVGDRRHGHLRVDRGARAERPGRAAEVEAGAGAVRVALLLAELHVQPGVEQPAEDRAHDRQRVEVVDPPRHADMPDPDLGLDRARPVDDADEPLVDRARRRRSGRSSTPRRPAPSRPAAARRCRGRRSPAGRHRRGTRPGPDRRRARTRPGGVPASSSATVSFVPPAGRWYGDAAS